MVRNAIILLSTFLLSCNDNNQSTSESMRNGGVDTIYSAHFEGTPNYKKQIFRFEITDPSALENSWEIGETRTALIKVEHFEKYPTIVKGDKGIRIEVKDSLNHLYSLTPNLNSFNIQVYQIYPPKSVIVKGYLEKDSATIFFWREGRILVGEIGTQDFDFNLAQ